MSEKSPLKLNPREKFLSLIMELINSSLPFINKFDRSCEDNSE
ncbi:unnamed protein product [Schistosoma mattheei]|uniref:Uncharacterized protein n=1 Tax=Schistosoma mattheei TaxID=31246 RepID=A0A3P8F9V0_9TREM|nr:unnamed protein product [Schistosoma mattheei]